jgi:23S rRNA (pseudouridine1915-N3)-methyltransferase
VLPEHAYVIALDVVGKQLSSPELADKLQQLTVQGVQPCGVCNWRCFWFYRCPAAASTGRLSFSKLTFTHQMMRVLLLEQIYRAFKISRGEKYHW